MRNIFLIAAIMMIFLLSCEDSNEPSKTSTIKVISNLSDNLISKIKNNDNPVFSEDIDSIKIENARILISRMILHEVNTDENEDRHAIFVDPTLFVFHPDSGYFVGTAEVASRTYDKVKFELHRFSASEINQYAEYPVFADFATEDRYSVIIDGEVYKGEEITPFVFNGQVTANLSVNFLDLILEGNTVDLSIELDPNIVFNESGLLLDPNDPKNYNDIENNIKDAFKAIRTILF
jgi:hypothetical protein